MGFRGYQLLFSATTELVSNRDAINFLKLVSHPATLGGLTKI